MKTDFRGLIDVLEVMQEDDSPTLMDKLELAQELLRASIELAEEVVDDTGDENARAYLVDQLKIHAGRDHGFLSRDLNFDTWMERLAGKDEDDDENL